MRSRRILYGQGGIIMMHMRSWSDCDTPVRTLLQSLDNMDGRGWEVWGWVANGYQGLALGLSIRGMYEWEGLGGLGPGCKWLAGFVWEGLGCVGFVYKIKATSSNQQCQWWWPSAWSLVCGTEWNGFKSCCTLSPFFPVEFFLSFGSLHLRRNRYGCSIFFVHSLYMHMLSGVWKSKDRDLESGYIL